VRIAQVAPLYESVPPRLYGGTERIVSHLTERLVERGHDVTLFAAADSTTRARLVPGAPRGLRLAGVSDPLAYHIAQLRRVIDRASEFDVIHNHMDYLGLPLVACAPAAVLTTLHGRLDLADLDAVFAAFPDAELVAISAAQRAVRPSLRWRGVVHHGVPEALFRFGPGDGGYLAFLGRISPEKRLDSAIRVADAVGLPLKIAAKVDSADREYYERDIRPLLDRRAVEFIGEIAGAAKAEFLARARALLFPIDWPEPFGLVMIEALACGTPVVARRRGSVPEIVDDGLTGFVCDDEAEMITALRRLDDIDRRQCRRTFEARFSDVRMTASYLRAYADLLGDGQRGAA
jgi:glycosyltransferase involved in cell wall biosynthesis